jgi:membrane protein insertase Oxa1/YidC/SpoIIIJ
VNIFEVVVVQPIFNMLIALYSLIPGGDFGIALILFTVLIRFATCKATTASGHRYAQTPTRIGQD